MSRLSSAWLGLELRFPETLAEVEPLWRCFEQYAQCTAFQTFDWLVKWQRHVGALNGTQPVIVTGHGESGQLLLILPLAIERRGMTRRLVWLGSTMCDYNGPLLVGEFAAQAGARGFTPLWREITGILQAHPRTRFDLIDLVKMPARTGELRNPFADLSLQVHPSAAHLCTLDSDWDRFYAAKRSPRTRQRDRNKLKRLTQHGEVRFVDVEESGDVERTLEMLCVQKIRSLARMGVRNIFAQPGFREFLLDVATDVGARERVHLSRLEVGACVAAISFSLEFRGRYYFVLLSHDDGAISRFGPGRAHLHRLLERAIERGLRWFDFSIGDEPYKAEWAEVKLELYDHLAPATVKGGLVVAVIGVLRRAKRFIKRTPWAWANLNRSRAWLVNAMRPGGSRR